MIPRSAVRALALVLLVAASVARAQTPALLSYQGRVQTGTPPVDVNGIGQFKFALIAGTANVSVQAIATVNRFPNNTLGSFTVIEPGSGYLTPPAVTISGGGGSGAIATAVLTGGKVSSITLNNPGSGYTSAPTVTIAAPPARQEQLWVNNGALTADPALGVSLPVTNGLYSVLLGDTSITNMAAIPASAFGRPDVRLRVWFNGMQLTPDQRLATGGYVPSRLPGGILMDGGAGYRSPAAEGVLSLQQADSLRGWLSLKNENGATRWHINSQSGGLNIAEYGVADFRWFMQPGGRIGIGTGSPTNGLVHIAATASANLGAHKFLASGGVGDGGSGPQGSISLYADSEIAASVFRAFSDERIKNIVGPSDSARDLRTLLDIRITDYTYRDTVTRGSAPQKKVIAQQVEKVYPQAVSRGTDVLPDIFKRATAKGGWISLATDLKAGDRVRLCTDKAEEVHEVLEVRDGAFRTACTREGELFVYGREVKDFRTVDYEALAMLHISATQQMKKEHDADVKALREENAALKERLAVLEARAARLAAVLEKLDDGSVTISNLK